MSDPTLPPKEPGTHRWFLGAILPLTATEAAAVHGGAAFVADANKAIIVPTVQCADCLGYFADVRLIDCPVETDDYQPAQEGTQ